MYGTACAIPFTSLVLHKKYPGIQSINGTACARLTQAVVTFHQYHFLLWMMLYKYYYMAVPTTYNHTSIGLDQDLLYL